MEWLSQNWFFVLILAVFVGMHLFGHGGCGGGHGRHGKNDDKSGPRQTGGHRH
ncbi:DUF2933 domain-containing protein [Azospira restricta]|uniref:DUF2933 domain-containing protein n=1 Tax=Azospira restricta TaxID=404405 RepID=A0A974SQK2_9RHOO|nr:DUF2933 domain-containing protein [Azospira restricta]QRJ64612.1 DUF2933 domain-containing protein [Azospira restricta]